MSDAQRAADGAGFGGGRESTPLPRTRVERAGDEVERPAGSARLPGARRDGYTKLPTGPVGIEPVVTSGPDADAVGSPAGRDWEPSDLTPAPADDARLAPWALFAAIVALCASFFVGWGIPVAIVAVIASIMSLRRPAESRAMARWALVLSLTATVYSLGWLVWAGMQFERLG
ncbi:hypothetical protein [Microbacterium sp. XT11]|uniref:hypothetical protein n=1 Tax=Microbacterium sp. XT11 TaxID=367477 RepID=UPI000AEB7731|nr:hypothetical protein [Microbacterium sp. XT11]